MPTVFSEAGFRFHFYSNEGDQREPIHIHVAHRDGRDAKLWLYPDVWFAYNHGLTAGTQRWVHSLVAERRNNIIAAWRMHFGSSD